MSNAKNANDPATGEDVRRLFGDTSDLVLTEIVSLQPTIADLEKATMAKVAKVLTAAQRKALLDSRAKQ